jgi:hypothetical protein
VTVRELIAKLQVIASNGYGDVDVATEGCDCNGDVGSISFKPAFKKLKSYVLLERSKPH